MNRMKRLLAGAILGLNLLGFGVLATPAVAQPLVVHAVEMDEAAVLKPEIVYYDENIIIIRDGDTYTIIPR